MQKEKKYIKCSKTVDGSHIWNPKIEYLNIESNYSSLTAVHIQKCIACGLIEELYRDK